MSLLSRFLQAVRTWRPRRPIPSSRRAGVAVEQLDHRQLLSVNFTGNVPVDFPASQSPGVVVLPNNPNVTHPTIPPLLKAAGVNASGFDIEDIRVSYDSTNDTLSIGLDGPASGNAGQGEVIAGDADDNGNSATVNPAIPAIEFPPASGMFPYADFQDFPDMQGSEYLGAFLSFTSSTTPQIVAGYSQVSPLGTASGSAKPYEVAEANSSALPDFGTWLTQFTGTVFMQNSPTSPNLEFTVTHFSQLYQMETGTPLNSGSVIYIGGQGGSANDIGISPAFFPAQAVNIGAATLPVPSPTPTPTPSCPPQSPSILINPHEHRIIDTLHRDLVRVTILGTSNFNVQNINPSTVELDGVHAIARVVRKVRRDPFPMATYVFVADQLKLPKGLHNVTLTGTLNNGVTTIETSSAVLNIPYAASAKGPLALYRGSRSIYPQLSRIEAKHPGSVAIPSTNATAVSRSASRDPGSTAKLKVSYAPVVHTDSAKAVARPISRPVVKLDRSEHKQEDTRVPTRLRHSLGDYLDQR